MKHNFNFSFPCCEMAAGAGGGGRKILCVQYKDPSSKEVSVYSIFMSG